MSELEPVFAVLNQHLEFLVNQAGGILLGKISSDQAFYSTHQTKHYNNIEQSQDLFFANGKAEIKINKQLQNISIASSNCEDTNSSNERQEEQVTHSC